MNKYRNKYSKNTSLSSTETNILFLLLKVPKVTLVLKAYIYYKCKPVNCSCSLSLFLKLKWGKFCQKHMSEIPKQHCISRSYREKAIYKEMLPSEHPSPFI